MAQAGQTITVTFKPAFHALVACAETIAAEHGDEIAARWAKGVLEANWLFFCGIETERKPLLRLIQGGR